VMRRETGFTLIELLITIFMSLLIITAVATSFTGFLGQSRTQEKIVESNENMVGLELLRRDVMSAGYGLFWGWNTTQMPYSEAAADANNPYASFFNDSPSGAPRAIVSQHGAVYTGVNSIFSGSDYLVIKSMNVARNTAGEKWTYVTTLGTLNGTNAGAGPGLWNSQNSSTENFQINDRVIALEISDPTKRALVVGNNFYTTYIGGNPPFVDPNFVPFASTDAYMVYGIDSLAAAGTPRSPFNRADYFISANGPDGMPSRCAPNAGVLYKAVMSQITGTFTLQSLLDCVADMQVVYWLDTTGLGTPLTPMSDIATVNPLTAQQIRTELKQVTIYILTHEGRKDTSYTQPTNPPNDIYVGDYPSLNGRWYTLGANVNYRWVVYQLTIQTANLI